MLKDNEVKPELGLKLRLLVAEKEFRDRPFFKEVAETLEEVLQAVESGQTEGNLKPREMRGLSKVRQPNYLEKYRVK